MIALPSWHSMVVRRFTTALENQAPIGDTVEAGVPVRLDGRNRLEPDAERGDRAVKPRRYAEAGIPHFWLGENKNGQPVVHVHELAGSVPAHHQPPTKPDPACHGSVLDVHPRRGPTHVTTARGISDLSLPLTP
ncbi:hypothetical protein ACFQ1S_08890 [Kibdelosporangium lantanae]|uniref:Restriction endonuclease domain-containing protein n=1 Tax=Kibdelosporangium lantanae TaxID=1497396 RepID=A0ABW3M7U5_9PSEU